MSVSTRDVHSPNIHPISQDIERDLFHATSDVLPRIMHTTSGKYQKNLEGLEGLEVK